METKFEQLHFNAISGGRERARLREDEKVFSDFFSLPIISPAQSQRKSSSSSSLCSFKVEKKLLRIKNYEISGFCWRKMRSRRWERKKFSVKL